MYPPQNGAEVRLWKTAEKLASLGDLWVGAPPPADRPDADVEWIELTSPLFRFGPLWNELWTGLFLLGTDHPLRRPLADAVVDAVDAHDVSFDVVVCEFPQVADAARRLAAAHDAALLVNKHNAEHTIVDGFLDERGVPDSVRRRIVDNFRAFEASTIERADVTVFQSAEDRARFDSPSEATYVIPNGCDLQWIRDGGDPESAARECGVPRDEWTCVFLGSYDYAPNRTAATVISESIAPALPDVNFLLVGRNPPSVGADNVYAPGYVEDLPGALGLADVALCPLRSGSGTKLKMLDYFAAELPVVSTPVGVQGLAVEDGEDVLVRDDAEGFVTGIERLRSSPRLRCRLERAGRRVAADHSWETLLAEYDAVFETLREDGVAATPPRRP